MSWPRLSLSFTAYLTLLFGVLVVSTALTLAWVSDRGVVLLLESNGSANTERAARQIGAEIEGLFAPIEVGVSLMAHHRTNLATSLPIRLEGASFFRETLLANKSASSFYVGYQNGDFFMIRRLRDDAERAFFKVGREVNFIAQSIDSDGGTPEGRFLFFDKNLAILAEDDRPDYPEQYDPRQRVWYEQAMARDGVARTDLYVFRTTGMVGLTFAVRSPIAPTVVAADLTLEELSAIVGRLKPTPSAQIILLNASEQVVAHQTDALRAARVEGDAIRLNGLSAFPAPELRALSGRVTAAMRPGEHVRYKVEGRNWVGKAAPIALRGGDPLTLLVAMPEDELLADAIAIRDRILLVSLLIFCAAITLTLTLSMSTSAKLARLNAVAERVRHFDFSARFHEASPIREIDQLSRGLEKLRLAYAAFMRMLALIQRESERKALLPVLLNELSDLLGARKAVLYRASSGLSGAPGALAVEAVKDGERVFLFRAQPECDAPTLARAAAAPDAPASLGGVIAANEVTLPGLRNIALPRVGDEAALAFPLRDAQEELLGVILFFQCADRPDGAEELVAALAKTAAAWLKTHRESAA
ncbi:MAG: GAF domain-containing protein [Elsteraceae bacterium]